MKRAVLFCALLAIAAAPKPETLPFDAAGSAIEFTARKVVLGREEGKFTRFHGTIAFVEGNAAASSVSVDIEMGSVQTGHAGLTQHLKDADFFDVAKYPRSTFRSTSIKSNGGGYQVTGTLDLHGVTKTISFPAAIRTTANAVEADAAFPINRKDFKIEYDGAADNVIKDDVVIRLRIRAPRS
ncbi:MAG TPA: YceI family protein [Thermoanaerobaculia bacterium]|nr:YceI family protein [Thermoanaerobaculia bacterium]